MRHAGKRIVSSLCALALLAAMLPAQAMATGTTEPGASVQQELSETSDGETKTDTDAGNVSGQEGGENQNDLNGSEGRDDQTPNEEEKESTAEGGETDLSEDEKDEKTDGADLSGDDTTEADGSREPADGENDSGSQNGQNGGAEQGNLPPSNDGAETLEEPASGETENDNGETETTPQAEGVAKIGDTTYATLDKAVEEAAEGSTIEILQDCELATGFNKTLTFTGTGKITINKQLKSNGEQWMCFGLYDPSRVLTFDGSGLEVEWSSEVGTAPWLMLSLSGTLTVTNGAKVTFNVDSGSTGNRNAIYMNAGSVINVLNGSTFIINGNQTDGKEGQGIQLDKTGQATVNVKGDSTFEINGTNRGYVNSPTIYVEDSDFAVRNCTSNASNGGILEVVRSKVVYENNAGHGISSSQLLIKDHSTVTCDNNGYYGAYASSAFLVDGTSTLTVTHNSKAGDFAGLKITNGVSNGKVESGAVVTITDNYCSGLSNNGKFTFDEGASLTITGNDNDKGTSTYGGGIYNSGASAVLVLPSDAVIYNNHSQNPNNGRDAGDDIFNNTTATITFGNVGSNWNLDDCKNDEGNTVEGCTTGGVIDGWYDDSENEVGEDGAVTSYNRWNAHDGDGIYHVEKYSTFTDGVTTVSGTLSLKAAHGASATLQPADITIYMGGEDGYDGVLADEEQGTTVTGNNSLPTPGFYFTLPADLNQVLSNALGKDPTTAIDLSGLVTVTATGDDGKARTWKLERYGVEGGSSTAIVDEASGLERFIYKIVPMETGQAPVRVQFTDKETGWTATSDNFTPDTALHNEYTMELYTGGVNPNSITMTFELPTDKGGQTYTCGYDQENSKSGTLTVRYANNDALIIDAVEDMDAEIAKEDEMFYVEADSDQSFFINEQDTAGTGEDTHKTGVEVDFTDVSLLADDIITQERADALYDRAEQAAESAGLENVNMFAKYFDLVDKENGNAWLTPADGETVTVYWPYPAGTDKNTEFKLYHFEGLDREMQVEDVERAVYDAKMVDMTITKGETGITFETGSFSPFVLAWENPAEQPSGGSGSEENPAPTATPQPTPAPAEAETVAAPAAAAVPQTGDEMPVALLGVSAAGAAVVFVALLAVRKRRHGSSD